MSEMQVWLIVGGVLVIGIFMAASRLTRNRDSNPPHDPLTEAEVFLAYGRKKQAIELLEKALQKHPSRADIAARLRDLKRQG